MTSTKIPECGQQIVSTLHRDGRLVAELTDGPVEAPGAGEVLVRVEATPINPSDMMVLFPADPATARFEKLDGRTRAVADLSKKELTALGGRAGTPVPVGLEGAGTVVAAGENGGHLLGKKVAAMSLRSGMFSQYRTVAVADCVPLPAGVTAAEGAGMFCNPLTALAIVETLYQEGYKALIHTAGASNLGRMLAKICAGHWWPWSAGRSRFNYCANWGRAVSAILPTPISDRS